MTKCNEGIARLVLAVLLVLALGLSLASVACDRTPGEKIKVAVTIFPLADFVKNVAGDKVDVIILIPPGASPHTYDPKPGQVAEAAEARLLVVNGAGLDFWVEEKIVKASGGDILVLDASLALAVEGLLIADDDHDHDHGHGGHDHGGVNPHTWLDPVLAQKQVQAIAQALAMIDPDNRDFYIDKAAHYIEDLKELDEEIGGMVEGWSSREYVSLHPAWTYFASRYGLVEAAVIQKSPGQDPTLPETKAIIDLVQSHGIKAIFAEPQTVSQAAYSIAGDTGATVIVLDPIGGPDIEDRDSYLDLMRYNVSLMQEVMG